MEKKVDVGGFKLFCSNTQPNPGQPTVILESGYGVALKTWAKVYAEIADEANVFRYDRAGVGESERGEKPFHSEQIVANLRTLLRKEEVMPPYVLVGHSFGGLNVRMFAHSYPEEVAGLVLVEPSHEDQHEKWLPLVSDDVRRLFLEQFVIEGTYDDFRLSLEQVRQVRCQLGDLPLMVLSGGRQEFNTAESFAAWQKLHEDILTLSQQSRHVIVEHSGHYMQREQPAAVAQAIREMLRLIG
ncbi:MAG: alpha/beta fold hydrolase [Clostridia bacterium]